jgi:tetratricopeptide (TPR) repeat protein
MSRPRIVCVLLALVTLLVYLPVRHYAFVNFDDPDYVTENPMVQAGLTWSGCQWAFTTWHASNWHPLTWLSHMVDWQLFGLNAGGHHLVNVLFHATNAVLLFLLLLRLTSALWQSALIAALFAWHPLHVESVAWVAERKDVLSAFFGLLTLMAYVRYAQSRSKVEGRGSRADIAVQALDSRLLGAAKRSGDGSTRDYLLVLFFFACGLMSKPMLVTLPFVFLLLDYWPLQRLPDFELRISRWSRLVWEKWPFFALAAASCVVTFIAQKRGEAVVSLGGYPLSSRIANAAVAYGKYLFNSVYPVNLAVIYPLPIYSLPKENPWVQVAGAIIVLAMISWVIWRARRQRPYLLTGWLWYLGMLVPVVGLVQVGSQAMADRFTYLPLIGVFIGVVFGLGDLAKKLRLEPMVMASVAGVVLAGCLFATARQLRFWRDSETLFEHTLAATKDNPIAQSNLGTALSEAGQPQEAAEHFGEALRLNPGYAPAHYNLGVALTQTGHLQEAMEHFREALRLNPDYAKAHYNLGVALTQTGHLQEAIEHFREALRLNPDYAPAHYNLGHALLQTGQPQEAIEHFQEALRLKLDDAPAHNNLGVALVQTGQPQEAIKHYQEALRLQPNLPEAQYNLGNALLQTGQPQEATAHFQEALRLKPDYAMAHNNLGVALAQTGQPQEAIKHYQEALRLQPNLPDAHCDLGITLTEVGRLTEAITHFEQALQLEPNHPKAHNGLGLVLLQNGQADKAIAQFRTALQLQPDWTAARNNLGDALINFGCVLFQKGQMSQAIAPLQEGLQIRPDNVGAYNCLGFIFFRQGQAGAAVANFQKALVLQPDNADAHKYLAWILATCPDASVRNGTQAVELAQKANQFSGGGDPEITSTLAAAYAEAGRFPEAVTTAQKALQLVESQTNAASVINDLQTQIKCYQAGLPFRDVSLTNALPAESRP